MTPPFAVWRPTRGAFVAVNVAIVLATCLLVVAPLASRFAGRHAAMAEDVDELRRLTLIGERVRVLAAKVAGPGDPFLAVSDERVGSADLQASLEAAARIGGATFVGVRGIGMPRVPGLKVVEARLDIEGSLPAVAATVRAIEEQVPLLWVAGATLRANTDPRAPGGLIHAEIGVRAALRPDHTSRVGTVVSENLPRSLELGASR